MRKLEREKAIKVLRKHWKRSFERESNIQSYIYNVILRLSEVGIVNVPDTPEGFLAYCRELGLYKKNSKRSKRG